MGPVVWVEGIIGAGKSTLTSTIAERLNLRPIYEPVDDNAYLGLFYEDQERWGFPMQVELMARRYGMQLQALAEAMVRGQWQGAVLDRGLPGDRVFAKMLMQAGKIHELEWQTYEKLYDHMTTWITSPRLLVFLDVEPEVAHERVRGRARDAESGIPLDYLRDLRKGYLDLLVDVESGRHHWSRGMEVLKVPWNVDHQDPGSVVEEIAHRCRL
jgi:deoxyadenosine/deoxycytidine kinase